VKRLLLYPVGLLCLALGAAGLVLPVLPGWPFLLVGFSIVAPARAAHMRRLLKRGQLKDETFDWHEWTGHSVRAGFTTKRFPLVLKKTGELLDPANQRKFTSLLRGPDAGHSLPAASRFALLDQVHGDQVVVLEDESRYGTDGFYYFPAADAVVSNLRRFTLLVMTADCLSIFFTALQRRGRIRTPGTGWVGLAHAGWRGTRLGIGPKTLRALLDRSGLAPGDVRVAFGPSIGAAHYEVGPEFRGYFPARSLRERAGRLYLDLAGENRRQLLEAGIPARNILDPRLCTVARNAHFHSFRKERDEAGRIISFITVL